MALLGGRSTVEVQRAVDAVPFWWHSIDLGNGVVTAGAKSRELLAAEWDNCRVPDLNGKTLLDIGAWDGFFSFEAERRGAIVTALDYFEWATDTAAKMRYWRECQQQGVSPKPYQEVPGLWQPDRLPGKHGFDTARRILKSRVVDVVADFTTVDLGRLGTFDVVFFFGVLYHLREPFAAIERLAQVTRQLAIIETEAFAYSDPSESRPLFEFYPGAELNADPTNWWAPNLEGLVGLCRAAGFAKVVPTSPPPPTSGHYRLTVQAWKSD